MTTIAADAHGHAHDHHHDADHKPGFFARWFMSTNHKDIGTLYLCLSVFAGIVGGAFSGMMRLVDLDRGADGGDGALADGGQSRPAGHRRHCHDRHRGQDYRRDSAGLKQDCRRRRVLL